MRKFTLVLHNVVPKYTAHAKKNFISVLKSSVKCHNICLTQLNKFANLLGEYDNGDECIDKATWAPTASSISERGFLSKTKKEITINPVEKLLHRNWGRLWMTLCHTSFPMQWLMLWQTARLGKCVFLCLLCTHTAIMRILLETGLRCATWNQEFYIPPGLK